MRIYPKQSKDLVKAVLEASPHRKANYCIECDELVEEPMMICRDDIKRRGSEKIFVDDRAAKKLAKMVEIAIEAFEMIREPSTELGFQEQIDVKEAKRALRLMNVVARAKDKV